MLGAGAAGLAQAFPLRSSYAEVSTKRYRLTLKSATVNLIGDSQRHTAVWAYNGSIPGPEIRVRQGQRLQVVVLNQLREATTVHWHGIRLANVWDGVPGVTQQPIQPGETFAYEFTPPDAGTFWSPALRHPATAWARSGWRDDRRGCRAGSGHRP